MELVENYQIGHSSKNTGNIRVVLNCDGSSGVEVPFSHRHKFHAIYWIHDGKGSHMIDFDDYEIKPDRIFYVRPEQVHHMKVQPGTVYSAIQFSDEFAAPFNTGKCLQPTNDFPAYGDLTTEAERAKLQKVFDVIYSEYVDNAVYSKQIIISGIDIILMMLGRIGEDSRTVSNIPETVMKFKSLVNDNFTTYRCVRDYAGMLNVTPNYLNVLSRKYLGETALSIIHKRIILEIKRLLLRTDHSVSEIAYGLNFNELSYFSRFFKNETGVTPNEFRKAMNDLYQD